MIECPYCDGQGEVLNAVIKQTNEKIKICDECNTVWLENEPILNSNGLFFDYFMEKKGLPIRSEIEFETK
ncbi:MAG: hypothetical protein NC034_01080 [Ruminococcus sp.]|nr:hypothetical protein [Ruminococcus sp.]